MISKLGFDILCNLKENSDTAPDELARVLFKTEEEIEKAINILESKGFILGNKLLDKGHNMLESHRIDNAVILAAGMSTRFVPVNFEKPKGLLEVNGEPLMKKSFNPPSEMGEQAKP